MEAVLKSAETWDNSRDATVLITPAAPLTTPLLKGAGGMAIRKRTPEDRFWAKVQQSDGCWLWTGSHYHDGYGQFRDHAGRGVRAHRYSWILHNGVIAPGLEVCHACDVWSCVRPDHLFLGTKTDNMRDAARKGRIRAQKITHCPKGHPYDEGNTWMEGTQRRCKTCRRLASKDWFRRCRAKTERSVKLKESKI